MFDMLADYYLWVKAAHIISVIFWMAGLLYLPRLYVYHWGASLGGELDTILKIQERRLLSIIMRPAMIAAFVFGLLLMIIQSDQLMSFSWLHIKLLLLLALFGYHGLLSADRKKFERGERPRSEKFYRITNELPPVLIIIIVGLAVVKPF